MWLPVVNNELSSIRRQQIPDTFLVSHGCHRTQTGIMWESPVGYRLVGI